MSETSTANGKVVVNRAMSLDGFIAGPGHRMDWGGGRPLAPTSWRRRISRKARRVELEPNSSVRSGDATILRFRVRK